MPADLLAALERLARSRGLENPRLILAACPVRKPYTPWWVQ